MEKSKNKIFGWLFIIYSFIILLLPIIIGAILFDLGIEIGNDNGPASAGMLLKSLGVSSTIIYLLAFSAFIIGIVSPILIFIAGILLLKNKKSGIKLTIVTLSADFIFRFLLLIMSYSNVNVNKMFMFSTTENIIFYIFSLVDLCIIYYFLKQKEKILE